ncbi:MAG: hypothetical protein JKY96_08355, partial [Phycisphaerales bacterium]|nr:hypothetical protein [Phycisphaerales bacterium]
MPRPIKPVIVTGVIAALAGSAHAEPFTYQGSLIEAGVPANGSYDMIFQLADSASGGFALASDSVNNVSVTDGIFTVEIDFTSSLMNSSSRWLAITVEGTPLTPRVRMRETPRALNAVRANSAGSLETPFSIIDSSSTVFEIISTSSAGTAIRGVHSSNSGTTPAIAGTSQSTSSSAIGIYGAIAPDSPGGLSAGVRGRNHGQGSLGIGVYGSHDAGGWGVYGTAPTGRGVMGLSTSGTGVYAQTSNSRGLFATHLGAGTNVTLANDQYGVEAFNTSGGGGIAILGSGGEVGVEGRAQEEGTGNRVGVRGLAGSDDSTGLFLAGVQGSATTANTALFLRRGYGVYGSAQASTGTATAYGIYGTASGVGTQWAGYFNGHVHITGTLSKSSGSFKIDHPLEPETKYLSHSFIESPDMMNIYNGVAVLDGQGNAVITLPDYFEALNGTFRYQLTAIGASMPNLYISSEVSANEFAIAGGVAGAKVSWQVTGIR